MKTPPPDLSATRFYAILDSAWVRRDEWFAKCRQLLDGGADLIQVRAKRQTDSERLALLEEILPLFSGRSTPLIVNDDIELCLRYPNLGLHVGQDDLPAGEARRRLGPGRILGLSTHSIAQAKGAIALGPEILSYFAVGPVFATQTKPDYTPVGLELVREVAALQPALPFFCIGGINRQNVSTVCGAGAERVVIVSDVLSAGDSAQAVSDAKNRLTAAETGRTRP